LTTDNVARRDQILTELKSFEGSNPEYLAPLLAQMPPPNPPDLSDYTPEQHLSFTVDMPQVPQANGVALQPRYHVQLPPEYNPYRKYPMVLLLPGMGTPEQILDLWTGSYNSKLQIRQGLAGRHGFIAVSVDWKIPGQVAYGYSAREAATILKTLRSCFRQFSIDTDRVFLAGLGPGAEAAYDVAVAHPDTFAGVCGISGPIAKYTEVYSKNKHLGLPVYSVVGGKDIESRRLSAKTWNEWLTTSKLNDLILVEYHGRLPESFYEELPHVFRWFATNTRRHPNRVDDFELECDIFRPWDNRHYFYELLGLPEESVVWPEFWRTSGYEKMLKMSVLKKGNRFINLRPSKQGAGAIISLNPTIIDFAEKIEISGRGSFKDFVRPSVKTMLEDVRARADRQHPTWAKLIHDNRSWQVAD
jgi:hypothetical protein